MKKLTQIFCICLTSIYSHSQDIHFTMSDATPMLLNPALTGMIHGKFRATTNYKNQWGSISDAYNTIGLSVDGALFKKNSNNAYLGTGLTFYKDVAGVNNFSTTKVNFSLSGLLRADAYNTVSIGLMAGWAQQVISGDDQQWDSQYNGQNFDPSLPSNESQYGINRSFLDYGIGFSWTYSDASSTISSFDRTSMTLGVSYQHLSQPIVGSPLDASNKLYSKYVFHGSFDLPIQYSKLSVRPRFSTFFQGPSMEINVGTLFRYVIKDGAKYTGNVKGFAIGLGGYYRFRDAFSPCVEFELAGFSLGYSYDFNTSSLRSASNGLGGSEIYLKIQYPNPFFKFSSQPSFR